MADNDLEVLPAGMADLKEKKIREVRAGALWLRTCSAGPCDNAPPPPLLSQLKLLPNPLMDKKVLKVLAKDDRVELVKELFKLLAKTKKGGKK